jgi:hypothetical protein
MSILHLLAELARRSTRSHLDLLSLIVAYVVFGLLIYALVARIFGSPKVKSGTKFLIRFARALPSALRTVCGWLDKFPHLLLAGAKRNWLGYGQAACVVLVGVAFGLLLLLDPILLTASIAIRPEHPDHLASLVTYLILMLPLFMCRQVVLVGWRFLRAG